MVEVPNGSSWRHGGPFCFVVSYPAMPITIQWPGITVKRAEVWVVLHLSGMAKSARHARQLVKRGYVLLNGVQVDIRTTVGIGEDFTLEMTDPLRKGSKVLRVVEREYYEGRNPRQNGPIQEFRRG